MNKIRIIRNQDVNKVLVGVPGKNEDLERELKEFLENGETSI